MGPINTLGVRSATFAAFQNLDPRLGYTIREIKAKTGMSRSTVYGMLVELEASGLASKTRRRGYFEIKLAIFQPKSILNRLGPSLKALSEGRRFGQHYNSADVALAKRLLDGMVTLDYRAYELTRYQKPQDYCLYVDDVDVAAIKLTRAGLHEGGKGHIVILPKIGDFGNEVQRVYFDCLAKGGRSTLDAIAIELLHPGDVKTRGLFPADTVSKVNSEVEEHEP